jgi:antitoxin (DNA-binding transcriptional repressor) of toxin-antitoxin stability system
MTVQLDEAQQRLPELIEEAAGGAEVVISRGDGASFRLVPVVEPVEEKPPRKGGGARGLITIRDDFDDPIPGFEPYT